MAFALVVHFSRPASAAFVVSGSTEARNMGTVALKWIAAKARVTGAARSIQTVPATVGGAFYGTQAGSAVVAMIDEAC